MGPTAALTGTTYQASGVVSAGAVRGVVRYATSTTNASAALPTVAVPGNNSDKTTTPLRGKFIRIKNESSAAGLDFAFGAGAAPTLVYGSAATFGTGSAAAGWNLSPLEWIDVIVPLDATHVAWIQPAAAAASTIAFYCSEGQVGDK